MSGTRYAILATSSKFGGELDRWLGYPIYHYSSTLCPDRGLMCS